MPSFFFEKMFMDVSGRDALYQSVKLLNLELNNQLRQQRLCDQVYAAARQFNARLEDAMNQYNRQTNNGLNSSPAAFSEFAKTCHDAIYTYQPQLISAPGLWNQLKAHINNFLEQYRVCKPIFNTTYNELALNSGVRERFFTLKERYSPREEPTQNYRNGR